MPAVKKSRAQRAAAEVTVPDKLYFRIGEVAELCRVPTYVLRFWETEFPQLKPAKSSAGQRLYRKKEAEYALRVRSLLYDEGFTIAGARERLRAEARPARLQNALPFAPSANGKGLKALRHELESLLALLSAKPKRK